MEITNRNKKNASSLSRQIVILVFLECLLLGGGAWMFEEQHNHIRKRAQDNLECIQDFKVREIMGWRRGVLHEGMELMDNRFLISHVERFLVDSNVVNKEALSELLGIIKKHHGYEDVLVVDSEQRIRLHLATNTSVLASGTLALFQKVEFEKTPFLSDIYRNESGKVCIDMVVPLLGNHANVPPIANLVLRVSAEDKLFPLLSLWPAVSTTGENLLVRREGQNVIFLNDFRHGTNAALTFRIPLTETNVSAVMGGNGFQGIYITRNYNGVEVLASIKQIPNTPWALVTEISSNEAFSSWVFRSRLLLCVIVVGVVSMVLMAVVLWQTQSKSYYRTLFHTEADLRKWEAKYRVTLMSVGDAIISTDIEGRVELLNPVAEALTGWSVKEARGEPLAKVFKILNEETREQASNPVEKVLQTGAAVELANHTALVSKDGSERPIADAATPIRDENGQIVGVVLVFRDQTRERQAKRALQRSRDQLDLALRSSRMGRWSWNIELNIREFDETACRILGLGDSSYQGPSELFYTRLHPDDAAWVQESMYTVVANNGTYDVQYRVLWPDGSVHFISSRGQVEKDEMGNNTSVSGVLWDVSLQKQAEETLRISRKRFHEIIESTPAGYFQVDAIGRYKHVNKAWLGMHKYASEAEISGLKFIETQMDVARAKENMLRVLNGESISSAEASHRCRDGAVGWNLFSATPVYEAGVVSGFEGFLIDTTHTKEIERQVLRSQAELAAIYESAPVMIMVLNQDRQAERVNRALAKFFEFNESHADLREIGDVIGCNRRPKASGGGYSKDCGKCILRRVVEETFATGLSAHQIDTKLEIGRNGKVREVEVMVSTSRVEIQGESQVIVCLQDISAYRNLQTQFLQAQKMEAVGQLAGGVAHDFNNMLAAALLHLHLLHQEPNLPPGVYSGLKALDEMIQRASGLTRQLLMFSRRQIMQIKRLNLNQLFGSLSHMLSRLLGEQIEFSFLSSKQPAWIDGDAGMMEQIVMNLCINARDAMPKGGPLTLATSVVDLAESDVEGWKDRRVGQFVAIRVTDRGCGMSEQMLKRIFEPFFTTKEPGKGTGLGLATVYGIVQQHNGWVEVQSTEGKGSCFSVYLPLVSAGTITTTPAKKLARAKSGEMILLAEDDTNLRRVLREGLCAAGYEIIEASDGPDALLKWQYLEKKPNLLLSDLVMPGGINGMELSERLRKDKPELPVIITSGYSPELMNNSYKGLLFLQKPFVIHELLLGIRRLLDGSQIEIRQNEDSQKDTAKN